MWELVLGKLSKELGRLGRSENGNVAIIFALVATTLVLATGGAIDFWRATLIRSQMQDAVDASALSLSKTVADLTTSEMDQSASDYFGANFSQTGLHDLSVTPSYDRTHSELTVSSSGTMQTSFLGLIGINELDLNTTSTVTWGSSRLRVALVLDNTGSMDDSGKMDALQTATHNLLDQLEAAASENGDVYVSIIPFTKDVNVGSSQYDQSWIDWTEWDADHGSYEYTDCSGRSGSGGSGHYNAYHGGGGGDHDGGGDHGGGDHDSCTRTWVPDDHDTWSGCIMDRTQDYDTKNTAPSTGDTLFPAEEYSSCPTQMMGLSYDWTALNDLVDEMSPDGSTNQAIGLAWGWQSLTQSPFTIPAYDSDYSYKKIIIILSDGLNTMDRWYGDGKHHSSDVDDRQEALCDNIKADTDNNITIYAVQVDTGSDPESDVLKYCATDTDHFFLLTTADQIITTFDEIGTSLSDLRIAS
jgi:Flp pilus assembly protein TadG